MKANLLQNNSGNKLAASFLNFVYSEEKSTKVWKLSVRRNCEILYKMIYWYLPIYHFLMERITGGF